MENFLSDQDDLSNLPPFWCNICRISCASAINLHSHFLGSRHKKAEEALKNTQEGDGENLPKPGESLEEQINACRNAEPALGDGENLPKPGESLEEQINACKNAEPALGLEYIYEFRNHGYSRYECRLCNCFLGCTHMFMHIVGARHRIYYLNKHFPSLGITNAYIWKGPKKLKKLRDICVRVEKKFGRKQINVIKGDSEMFSCDAAMSPSYVNYQVDSKLENLDFTNDEFIAIEEKPTAEEQVVTFLELKTLHEASQKDQVIGQENINPEALQHIILRHGPTPLTSLPQDVSTGSIHSPVSALQLSTWQQMESVKLLRCISRRSKKGHKEKENKPDNSDSDIDPCDMECTKELDAFPNNRKLFEYLESFKVFELGDVHFLLKVSEKLRNALVIHKKYMESKEEFMPQALYGI